MAYEPRNSETRTEDFETLLNFVDKLKEERYIDFDQLEEVYQGLCTMMEENDVTTKEKWEQEKELFDNLLANNAPETLFSREFNEGGEKLYAKERRDKMREALNKNKSDFLLPTLIAQCKADDLLPQSLIDESKQHTDIYQPSSMYFVKKARQCCDYYSSLYEEVEQIVENCEYKQGIIEQHYEDNNELLNRMDEEKETFDALETVADAIEEMVYYFFKKKEIIVPAT